MRFWLALAITTVACGDPKPAPATPISSASTSTSSSSTIASREDTTLPPRNVFFGNPDRTRVRIAPTSPAATKLAYLANENGVLNVFVGDGTTSNALTHASKRNVHTYEWSMDGKYILYFVDENGGENWRLRAVTSDGKNDRELFGQDGAKVILEHSSAKRPSEVVVSLHDGDHRDLYVVDVPSGRKTLLQKTDGFEHFIVDDDFRIRFGMRPRADGGVDVEEPNGAGWKNFTTIPPENRATTELVGFDKSETTLYMLDSRGRSTAALVTIDLKTKKSTTLLDDGAADIEYVLVHPTSKIIQAAEANYDRTRWHVIDKSIDDDFDYLRTVAHGDLGITSRTLDDKKWLVAFATEGPTRYYVYDREAHAATFLFVSHDALANVVLATMTPLTIKARDGIDLVSYVTLPAKTAPPPPLVVVLHGPSRTRASYGFNPTTQWLASRGYAVLQVNYRVSKMHDDVVDAVKWVVSQNFADAHRTAIYGNLAFAPDGFSCAVVVNAPNLQAVVTTHEPMLVGLGKNDAIQKNDFATFVVDPNEGHAFARPENRRAFNAVAEVFLAQCLGGSYQAIGNEFSSSSLTVPFGREKIPGL